jgi:nucleoside-diphosphate-sugar epimerase
VRILVTGSSGCIGRVAVGRLARAGHDVVGTDITVPKRMPPGQAGFVLADLTDAGDAYAVIRGFDAVVHTAAIPLAGAHPGHTVFRTNTMATYNCVEAAVRSDVTRFVNFSSEAAAGHFFAERTFLPQYLPVDEDHPLSPEDPYALSKVFGEQMMDAVVRRSPMRVISIRSSSAMWEGNAEEYFGPQVRDPAAHATPNVHSYIDVYDLADAVVAAVASDLPGHEVIYVASPDTVGGHDLTTLVRDVYRWPVPLHDLARPDASGVSSAKATRLLGWTPTRSWRDWLGAQGQLLPDVRQRLEAGLSLDETPDAPEK